MKTDHTPLPWHDSGAACLSGPNGEPIAIFQDLYGPAQANLELVLNMFSSDALATARAERLQMLLARSLYWIAKAQADGAYANCASPHGAERLLNEIRTALEKKS